MRGVKDLLLKHGFTEQELALFEKRINELRAKADQMIRDGHPEAANIKKELQKLINRLSSHPAFFYAISFLKNLSI